MYKEECILQMQKIEQHITAERLGVPTSEEITIAHRASPSSQRNKTSIRELQVEHTRLTKLLPSLAKTPDEPKKVVKKTVKKVVKKSVVKEESTKLDLNKED